MPPLDRDRAAQLLGVAADASPATLRRAYRAAARRFHPDTLGRPATEGEVAAMAAVNGAYALLRRLPRTKRGVAHPVVRPPDRVIDMRAHLDARPRPGPLRPIAAAPPPTPITRPVRAPRPSVIRPRPAPPPVDLRQESVELGAGDPTTVTFDFGRYEGWVVAEVEATDPDYCDWALRHARTPVLRAALRRARLRRPSTGTP